MTARSSPEAGMVLGLVFDCLEAAVAAALAALGSQYEWSSRYSDMKDDLAGDRLRLEEVAPGKTTGLTARS